MRNDLQKGNAQERIPISKMLLRPHNYNRDETGKFRHNLLLIRILNNLLGPHLRHCVIKHIHQKYHRKVLFGPAKIKKNPERFLLFINFVGYELYYPHMIWNNEFLKQKWVSIVLAHLLENFFWSFLVLEFFGIFSK